METENQATYMCDPNMPGGEQRAKDGLMALEKEMKRDDRGRNQQEEYRS